MKNENDPCFSTLFLLLPLPLAPQPTFTIINRYTHLFPDSCLVAEMTRHGREHHQAQNAETRGNVLERDNENQKRKGYPHFTNIRKSPRNACYKSQGDVTYHKRKTPGNVGNHKNKRTKSGKRNEATMISLKLQEPSIKCDEPQLRGCNL